MLGTSSGFFQSKPMRFISLISPDLPQSMPNRLRDEPPHLDGRRRQNLHRPGAKLVELEGRQRAGSALEIEKVEFLNSAFVEGLEPGANGRIVDEKNACDVLKLHATIKEKDGVRPAGDAMLLQPVPGDLHQDRPIRRAEEIAARFHQAIGIDPADSVKRFSEVRGFPTIRPAKTRKTGLSTGKSAKSG